jgi:hypothetical protein
MYRIEIMSICMCLLRAQEGYTNFLQIWHAYALEPGRYFRMVKTVEKYC